MSGAADSSTWPPLPLTEWEETRDTLQLWTQMVGKIRMANTPQLNHWWNVPLYVSATGLTTSLIPHPGGDAFQVDFDLSAHELVVVTVSGSRRTLPLRSGPIAEFYRDLMRSLDDLGIATPIWPMPVEIDDAIPFLDDELHGRYDPEFAHRFWIALTRMTPVFEQFRSRFLGKASPVHLFWGALDLATTRFSGRPAPPHPGGAPNCGPHVMLEAYSHEVSSLGYWPGGGGEGVFYSYAYPRPAGYSDAEIQPGGAFWSEELGEFVLPYEIVRTAVDPTDSLLAFAQTTYDAAAITAKWDREALQRRSPAT
jgi:hypothetical protein